MDSLLAGQQPETLSSGPLFRFVQDIAYITGKVFKMKHRVEKLEQSAVLVTEPRGLHMAECSTAKLAYILTCLCAFCFETVSHTVPLAGLKSLCSAGGP